MFKIAILNSTKNTMYIPKICLKQKKIVLNNKNMFFPTLIITAVFNFGIVGFYI